MSEPPASEPAAPVLPEPLSPADLAPAPSRRERLAWYAGAMLVSCALVFAGLRLDQQDLRAPLYYDLDALLYLPIAKNVMRHGTHWHNDQMGAPGVQELYDFPVIDYLHFGFLWLFGRLTPDVLLAYNAYNLLTYPLTVLTGMLVMRWLKLSLPAAAVGGLLYAFLPYHQERQQYHYFLAAYWAVPLSLMPALSICKGSFPLFPLRPDGPAAGRRSAALDGPSGRKATRWARFRPFTLGALWTVAVGVLTASAGAYYAFFACAGYAFAGLYAAVVFRTWRAAAAAALVIAPVVAAGVAYHVPTIAYQSRYGVNPITDRGPEEAEMYGLKLAHLLLPTTDHNLGKLSRLRAMYAANRPADSESGGSLGFIGGAGLVGLLGVVVFARRRRWPEAPVGALVLFFVLLGTVGGFGSVYNLIVSAQIRAYARISVFIGFLCLFAAMWWLDLFLLTRTGARAKRLRIPVLALVFVLGYLDQTPWGWNPFNPDAGRAARQHAERFRADARFFREVEERFAGARVFCLPYVSFPESPPVRQLACYEHARGYVFTDALTWSFGAVKRREADMWQKEVAFEKPDEFLRRIVVRGFDGLFIDARGFPRKADPGKGEPASAANPIDRVHALYADLVQVKTARLPEVVHEDGKQFYLDLRPYRDAYRRLVGPEAFERQATREREWIAPLWLKGFTVYPQVDDSEQIVWGTYTADLVLVNPTDRTRRVEVSFDLAADGAGLFQFAFTGPPGTQPAECIRERRSDGSLGQAPAEARHTFADLELPPGRSVLRFRCTPPDEFVPADHRKICFFVRNFRLVEK